MSVDQGFKLHPGAAHDITEIWQYIAEDNPLAAGRAREEILDTIRMLSRLFPLSRPPEVRTHLTPNEVSRRTRIPDCLRTRRKANCRYCCITR